MAPLYAAEVGTDVALGAVMITEDIVVLLQDFVTPMLLSSPMQPVGVFLMYGLFSVIGLLYIYFYVPETKGLSEQEKREIFQPGAKYGRKLKEGEETDVGIEHRSDATIAQELFREAISIISSVKDRDPSTELLASKYGFSKPQKLGELGPAITEEISEKESQEDKKSAKSCTSESVSLKTENELELPNVAELERA